MSRHSLLALASLSSLSVAGLVMLALAACGISVVGVAPNATANGDASTTSSSSSSSSSSGGESDSSVVGDSGSDDAASGDAGSSGDASTSACPATGRGPVMVDIGGTCIDSTEVTEAQYKAFLDSNPALPTSAACNSKTNYQPLLGSDCRWDPAKYPNLPIVCVDWCDAAAFCTWAGKRLCGKIGGGSIVWNTGDDIDATKDQWFRGCSKAGTQKYPYGTVLVTGACQTSEGSGNRLDAGSITTCQGGYGGIFDMVGNVYEWEDSCDGTASLNDPCKLRGGSWYYSQTDTLSTCNKPNYGVRRRDHYDDTGFRCCAP